MVKPQGKRLYVCSACVQAEDSTRRHKTGEKKDGVYASALKLPAYRIFCL